MTRFRKHLESAKTEYQQTRYDGDLAAELLARSSVSSSRMHIGRWMWNVGAVAAAAAMIVLFFRLRTPGTTPDAPTQTQGVTEVAMAETLTHVGWSDLPSIQMPAAIPDLDTRGSDEMNFAPAAPDFSFSVPSFSFNDDAEQSSPNSSTQQETTL